MRSKLSFCMVPLLLCLLLCGCDVIDRGFLSPAGPIASAIKSEFLRVCLIMFFVIGPVLLLTPLVAWHYRLSNTRSAYRPQWGFNWPLEGLIWIPPSAIVVVLAVYLWRDTHQLDPYRPLPGTPVEIQAVALDWKWLFIYPGSGVATVNRLVIPAGQPVHLSLTSATVMQSLLMPRLAGQIYAMAGMRTQLNFEADQPGLSWGENVQFNGQGFQNQKFDVDALSPDAFARWLVQTKAGPERLDTARYQSLSHRSVLSGALSFGAVDPDLFDHIVSLAVPAAMGSHCRNGRLTFLWTPARMVDSGSWHLLLGTLSWGALPFVRAWRDPSLSEIIGAGAGAVVVVGAVALFALVTHLKAWRYLWTEWFTSVDHKKIGIMYIALAGVMLSRALIEAVLMRTQQALAINAPGVVGPHHFAQLFTTHGSIMIFFMAMPFLTGLINYIVPLQIGARDMAFPYLNSVGLWLTVAGAGLMMVSLVVGEFSTGGWSGYPPFTELSYNGGPGPDYWIWAVSLASIGSTTVGINVACTIYKLRAPGMTWMRLPLFCWTSLCTSILMIFAMPPLTVATLLLAFDRYAGMHFFTDDLGGNVMNYVNLFWLFGHPEVYIVVLPAFGVYSEVVSAFSSKELYGYTSLVIATAAIAVLSFMVWLHHFFTMGQSAGVNAAFGIATMLIGIPTGVKIYDWIWTMFRGEVRFTPSMLLSIAFMMTFVLGGFTGIILATPPLDYMMHNTLFLVAHFHNMLIAGTLYGLLAGYMYWFPKAFGFRLNERWGWLSVACWVSGFYLAFMPLYVLGAAGMARRTQEVFDPAFRPWLLAALVGAFLLAAALGSLFVQLFVSIRDRDANRVFVGDPWDARGLEWSVSAPPPEWNFATIPQVSKRDAFYWRKRNKGAYQPADHYRDIEMPKETACGLIIGLAAGVCGFGLVWRIWWLAALFLAVVVATVIIRSLMRDVTRIIPAATVEAVHRRWLAEIAKARPIPRQLEQTKCNEGLAQWMA